MLNILCNACSRNCFSSYLREQYQRFYAERIDSLHYIAAFLSSDSTRSDLPRIAHVACLRRQIRSVFKNLCSSSGLWTSACFCLALSRFALSLFALARYTLLLIGSALLLSRRIQLRSVLLLKVRVLDSTSRVYRENKAGSYRSRAIHEEALAVQINIGVCHRHGAWRGLQSTYDGILCFSKIRSNVGVCLSWKVLDLGELFCTALIQLCRILFALHDSFRLARTSLASFDFALGSPYRILPVRCLGFD